jgi:hypothetical protein
MNARMEAPPPAVTVAGTAGPLPVGTCLQEFRLLDVVGQGGFGVVYRAQDTLLRRLVAIKEYLPGQLALRSAGGGLGPVAPHHADTYAAGLDGFLDEARLLARFKHPALLEVLRFWEENGTAYLAMPLYPGLTLEQVIEASPAGLDAVSLRAMLGPLLDAVELLHGAGCMHRDISPDNLIVRPDGSAVLLDLGAARRAIGDRVRATTVMLKAGYAPIEQYADDPSFRVGPWSDVYAIAAVLHHAITGRPPLPSPMRVMRDSRAPLAAAGLPGFDDAWLRVIDEAMALRPVDRPQSIAAFRERLRAAGPAPAGDAGHLRQPSAVPLEPALPGALAAALDDPPTAHAPRALVASAVAAVIAVVLGIVPWSGGVGPIEPEREPPADVANGLEAGYAPAVGPAARPGVREPAAGTPTGAPVRTASGSVRDAKRAPSGLSPATAAAPARAASAAPAGALQLSVFPWAEVWVDGVQHGVTPPLKSIALPAGPHRIELRNPSAEPVRRRVDVQAGQSVDVAFRFGMVP